jgi:cytochrome P450
VIDPMPPVASGLAMPWDAEVADPVAALGRARRELGDTFALSSGGDWYLFVFGPVGVRSFYALAEAEASKGVADWRLLRRKLPDELFDGRRTLPHELFRRDDVANYLDNVAWAVDVAAGELDHSGQVELFALTRRLAHRVGLASWAGRSCATGERFERLCAAFDVLDGAESFVHPDAMAAVARSGQAAERAALSELADLLSETLSATVSVGAAPPSDDLPPLARRIGAAWRGEEPSEAVRGAAYDVVLLHLASMSNLYAAMAWMLIDLVERPPLAAIVGGGDRALAERCALESIRLSQRSIMARYTLAEFAFETDGGALRVSPGVTVATLLPLTNTTAGPGLDGWNPDRWARRRLADTSELAAVELVATFGHGTHTCPAQPFSLAAMVATAGRLLGSFNWEPRWAARPRPVPAQIGGVARSADPSPAAYRRRAG